MPQISIIVPVFGAEKYLHRCLDSILAQTFTNWECILVDDGSKDSSGTICDEYAQKDYRFRVIHKPNGGVSSARQFGLDAAEGEFVIHTDSDDWLEPCMLNELIRHQEESGAECVIFDFFRVTNETTIRICQLPTNLHHKQVLKDIIGGKLYACCWNKLIKRSSIMKWGAKFPKNINFGEDKCFLASLFRNPISISYLPKPLYYYDASINENSLVRRITKQSMESGFAMVKYIECLLDKEYYKSIFVVKRNLKVRAISSGLYSNKEIRSMYNEIDSNIIFNVLTLKAHARNDIILFLFYMRFFRLAKFILHYKYY